VSPHRDGPGPYLGTMATEATRGTRPSLPALLALLLALIAGLAVPPLTIERAGPRTTAATSVTRHSDAPVEAVTSATTELPAETAPREPVAGGRERELRTQLFVAARAARAPPAAAV
jgi:hypothetical protein